MDKRQAAEIVRKTFESPFDRNRFINFINNLLNSIDTEDARTNQGNRIPDQFNEYVSKIERVGKYTCDEKQIMIFIVHLKKETSIERARSMQRNFIAWYLKHGNDWKDAALVAFVSPDSEDWRFSLVKMDYKINEKGKIKEEFTPARRWSFLVGTHEKSHTAQSKLVPIMLDDEHNPSLGELEEAFNIEKVTKEFFNEYRTLFLRTKEELDKQLDNNPKIKTDFEKNNVNTVDFAKKLLGQIVFLYFLQKKGWFGVQRDAEWGTGSKQFLRELFDKKHGSYSNFFNDILESLFYEALRNDRTHDDHYYSKFNCKIPFLNGGLFDPINNYDWWKTDILLPNDLFSNNKRINEVDTGDGILDIFDRYNFTVKEDEPLEKEVAIDPELLGKAYEKFNAIRPDNYNEYYKSLKSGKKGDETKFNKQYGVYYTPREIVHYMCQQSLINYLFTELNDSTATYEKLGHEQTEMFGNEAKTGQLDFTIEHHATASIAKEDIEILVHYGDHISENEAHIEKLGKETDTYKNQLPESIRKNADGIDRKLASIKVCDPAIGSGAFPVGMMSEIVRTRNVLSHFTKEQDKKERTVYHFKRDCIENSIYGVDIDSGAVEIAKLRLWLSLVVDEDDIRQIKPLPNLDYKIVCGNSLLGVEKDLFNGALLEELEKVKLHYFNETNPTKKQEYKKQINDLIYQITNGHTEFDFEIYFSEVFHEKGGFDVVIGNPPYVDSRKVDNKSKTYWKLNYISSSYGKTNTYEIFIEKSTQVTGDKDIVALIIPTVFLNVEACKALREHIIKNYKILKIAYSDSAVFDEANVDTIVIFIQKTKIDKEILITKFSENFKTITSNNKINISEINQKDGYKISLKNDPITNRLHKNFNEFIKISDIAEFYNGIATGPNKEKYFSQKKLNTNYKPLLMGNNIGRYRIHYDGKFINYNKKKLHRPREEKIFLAKEKIIMQRIRNLRLARRIVCTLDNEKYYTFNSVNNLLLLKKSNYNIRFLLALLNSKLLNYLLKQYSLNTNITLSDLELLPIKKINFDNENERKIHDGMVSLVNGIIELQKSLNNFKTNSEKEILDQKINTLDRKIDEHIYKLYELTDEEIAIVEGDNE